MDIEEKLLLAFMTIVSSYMFIEAFNFTRIGRLFPQITTGVVVVGALLLLFSNYLPSKFSQLFLDDDIDVDNNSRDEQYNQKEKRKMNNKTKYKQSEVKYSNHLYRALFSESNKPMTFIIALLYVVVGYLIGLLWATPLAMIAYAKMYNLSLSNTLIIVIVGSLLATSFMFILDAPFYEGLLTEGLL